MLHSSRYQVPTMPRLSAEPDPTSRLVGDVYVVTRGTLRHRRVRFHKRRPLGFGRLIPVDDGAPDPAYDGTLLPGYLRAAGAIQLSHRHPVAVPASLLPTVRTALLEQLERARQGDPAWIEVHHCAAAEARPHGSLTCLFLTRRQRHWLEHSGCVAKVTAPTEQVLEATVLGTGESMTEVPPEYRQQLLDIPDVVIAPPLFQLGSGYRRSTELANPYLCVLNPVHRGRFGSEYCMLRNHHLEAAYPGLLAAIAALLDYDAAVPEQRVLLDATLSLSIGMRFGEVCTIEPLTGAPGRAARRAFRYRHSICRVGRTGPADMEKPLVRVPEAVLDSIGIEAGAQIVVEGVTTLTSGRPGIRRIKLRALPTRETLLPFTPDTPDYFDETGSLDLPIVQLDAIRRRTLGLVQGSPVYVRPALPSILASEVSSVLLLLAAAIVGTVSTETLWLSAVLVTVYVAFVLWTTLRKFR